MLLSPYCIESSSYVHKKNRSCSLLKYSSMYGYYSIITLQRGLICELKSPRVKWQKSFQLFFKVCWDICKNIWWESCLPSFSANLSEKVLHNVSDHQTKNVPSSGYITEWCTLFRLVEVDFIVLPHHYSRTSWGRTSRDRRNLTVVNCNRVQ